MAKTSLSELEARFHRVLDTLRAPVSGRWATSQAGMFLEELPVGRPEAEAYLLPMMKPLAERAEALDPVGLSPDTLGRAAARLRRARQAHRPLRESAEAGRAERALRRRAGLLCGYAGAVRRAVSCLRPSSGKAAEAGQPAPGGEPEASGWLEDCHRAAPEERLEEAAKRFSGTGVEEEIKWVVGHWELEEGPAEESSTRVPVVERPPSWTRVGGTEEIKAGGLRRLDLRILGPAEKTDRLRAEALENSLEGQEEGLAGSPVAAARKALGQRHSSLRGKHLEGRLTLDQTGLRHEGRSAGLAVATLFYGAALRHMRLRRRLQVRREVLVTGEVAEGGEVRPVSAEGLPAKVQAAFFSPKTRLVVPEAQQEAAEKARDELLGEFPEGKLEISGAGDLNDVLSDRRLTRVRRIGRFRHAAQRLWNQRWKVGASVLALGLLLAAGFLTYAPIDQNPESARFSGSTLFVENERGRTLEEIEVGRSLVRKIEDGRLKAPVAFADMAGGESREVFWGAPYGEDARMDALYAKAIGTDTLLWERPLRFEVDFPGKPEVSTQTFGIAGLTAGDLNRDGSPELYALANHRPYFPSLLLRINPESGQVQRRYVHPGHLRSGIETADLAGGPAPELLVGGHSNAFGDPVLAVLRPSSMAGHAPTRGDYRVGGADLAAHVAYLRFPSTAVQERRPADYPMVWQIRPAPAAKTLEVVTQDGRVPDEDSGRPRVITTLSFGLEPRSVGTDGTYDQLANSLLQHGVLEAVPGPEDLRRYGERVRYWTGSGWSAEPRMSIQRRNTTDRSTTSGVSREGGEILVGE